MWTAVVEVLTPKSIRNITPSWHVGHHPRRINQIHRIVLNIGISIQTLGISNGCARTKRIYTRKSSLHTRLISRLRKVQSSLCIILVTRELLPRRIAHVALGRRSSASPGVQLFTERQIVVPPDTRQAAR